jgi:hypothetical protein
MNARDLFDLRDRLAEAIIAGVGEVVSTSEDVPFVDAVRTTVEQLLTDYDIAERTKEAGIATGRPPFRPLMGCSTEPIVDHAAAAYDEYRAEGAIASPIGPDEAGKRAYEAAARWDRTPKVDNVLIPLIAAWAHTSQQPQLTRVAAASDPAGDGPKIERMLVSITNTMPGEVAQVDITYRVLNYSIEAHVLSVTILGRDARTAAAAYRARRES